MGISSTIILSGKEVKQLLTMEESIAAVEQAFKLYGENLASPPGILGIHAQHGGFHIKAGLMDLGRYYFVSKTNSNFHNNKNEFGLPTIQGLVIVMDANNGFPLAIMDSIEITIIRTGAATAVAARYLSKPDSKVATICGCGEQGRVTIQMLQKVRKLELVYAYDIDEEISENFAREFSDSLSITVKAISELKEAVSKSDIVVTCTTSKIPFLKKEYVPKGCFIAAVGADNEEKHEMEPGLLASSKLVTDLTEQGATIGELHHAIEDGVLTREFVYAELGEIVAGKVRGRVSPDEIFLFDSTGMALQDVASAALVYEKSISNKVGIKLDFKS